MANGRPGDHPVTDLLRHNFEVYGEEPDRLLREMASIMGYGPFRDWWEAELAYERDPDTLLKKARMQLAMLKEKKSP